MHVKPKKTIILHQNFIPRVSLNVFFAMKNCIAQVTNCTQRLVKAAPIAKSLGMKMKFSAMLMTTPTAATIFSCLRFPFAVRSVPKIYVIEIETKLPIKIFNIVDELSRLYMKEDKGSPGCWGYIISIKLRL